MQRRILADGLWYICDITQTDNIEHWTCANAEKVADVLKENGAEVVSVDTGDVPQRIEVDRSVYHFKGEKFMLNQCSNILDWFSDSMDGDFTYYYDRVVFNTSTGFIAAYSDNLNNYFFI